MKRRFKLHRLLISGAVLALLAGATTVASATTYQFKNLGTDYLDGGKYSGTTSVYVKASAAGINDNIHAGVFNSVLVKDDTEIVAALSLCNDLQQSIGWAGSGKNTYTPDAIVLLTDTSVAISGSLPSSVTIPSATVRSEVAYLMDTYLYAASYEASDLAVFKTGTSSYASNMERAAALQAAVWKLWYGTSSTVYPYDYETQTVMNNLLAEASGYKDYESSTAVWVYDYTSCSYYQDQLMVMSCPVPEPAFYQLTGLAGLVVLGFRRRRRCN